MNANNQQKILEEQNIKLNLTIEEINKIMTALVNLPYIQVYQIIHKIQLQTGEQLVPKFEPSGDENGQTVKNKI